MSEKKKAKRKKAVAVWQEENKKLLFYCDEKDHSSEGIVYKLEAGSAYVTLKKWQAEKKKIKTVTVNKSFKEFKKLTKVQSMFEDCISLETIEGIDNFDTSNVVDMSRMFNNCKNLQVINISSWDTSKVKDMSFMFSRCENLQEVNVSKIDTSNTLNMRAMFHGCKNLKNLKGINTWNTKNLNNARFMFSDCEQLKYLSLSDWDINAILSFGSLNSIFKNCKNLKSIDLVNLSYGKINKCDTGDIFDGCNNLEEIKLSKDILERIQLSYKLIDNKTLVKLMKIIKKEK